MRRRKTRKVRERQAERYVMRYGYSSRQVGVRTFWRGQERRLRADGARFSVWSDEALEIARATTPAVLADLRYEGACGDLAPDGALRCIMLAGHLGNHAHAPDGTADWVAWTPSGDLAGAYSFPAAAGR